MKVLNRNTIAIFIASLFSFQMYISGSLLASMYAWFTNVNPNLIILLYSAPTLVSALIALALGPVMNRINKKMVVVLGLGCIVAGGVLIVFIGGASFPLALTGTILCGAGYAFVLNGTNTMLAEMNPMTASTTIAMNSAAGALGSMAITSLAGVLAKDGNWTRSYLLCFPAAVTLLLFLVLYRDEPKAAQAAQQTAAADMSQQAAFKANWGLCIPVLFIFFLAMVGNTAWNANFSTYIMAEQQIGSTVETGLISTMASLGGVIGGFVVAGILIPRLKTWTVPICMLFVMAPNLAAALGVNSMMVLYICAAVFMIAFNPVYGAISAAAGKTGGSAGVTGVNAVMGLGGFIAPYILNFVGTFGDGTSTIKFWAGVACQLIAAAIAIPIMKKASE